MATALCEKCLIWSFSGLCFPTFGLNTERYSVSFHIQSECGKIRTRKNPNKDSFHVVQNGYKSLKNDDYRSIIKGNGLWRSLYLGFIHLVRAQNFSKN